MQLISILSQLAFYVPLFVVYVIGAVMALDRRQRYPQMASRVVLGVVIDSVVILAGIATRTVLLAQHESVGLSAIALNHLFTTIGVVQGLLHTVAYAILLSAVFADRESAAPAVAATEPAVSVAEYSQIPWYRKRWFIALTFLFFLPATVALVLSGDVYANRGGVVRQLTPAQRYTIAGVAVLLMLLGVLRLFVAPA